ncbi:MAG: lipoprotein [Gammaproteobacteria bacterium]|nr:lipoprotein [Gammaproteobacteria bacterium]MDT8371099.1 lipoprotein [Gammaproteobacteria bacterium]
MLKNKILMRITVALCIVFAMAACGQKGDLYLPEGSAFIAWLG